MSILDFANEDDMMHCRLSETREALSYIAECMEFEGYQRKEKFQDVKAIIFARRFPAMLSTLLVDIRDMDNTLTELGAIVDRVYKENKTA